MYTKIMFYYKQLFLKQTQTSSTIASLDAYYRRISPSVFHYIISAYLGSLITRNQSSSIVE